MMRSEGGELASEKSGSESWVVEVDDELIEEDLLRGRHGAIAEYRIESCRNRRFHRQRFLAEFAREGVVNLGRGMSNILLHCRANRSVTAQ